MIYAEVLKAVGDSFKVPLIDLYAHTRADLMALGKEQASAEYRVSEDGKDISHTNHKGRCQAAMRAF